MHRVRGVERIAVAVLVLSSACGGSSAPRSTASPPAAANEAPTARVACSPPTPRSAALVATLDDDPDPLHSDSTPSVHALIAEGRAGACAVLDRLIATDRSSRMHAQRVLEGVLAAEHGWRAGRGFPSEHAEEQNRSELAAIEYDFDASTPEIEAGASRWRAWVETARSTSVPVGPAPTEMISALAAVHPQLEECGLPVDVTVVFDRAGTVSSIWGAASEDPRYRRCLAAATASVRVRPLARESVWIRYPWVP